MKPLTPYQYECLQNVYGLLGARNSYYMNHAFEKRGLVKWVKRDGVDGGRWEITPEGLEALQ